MSDKLQRINISLPQNRTFQVVINVTVDGKNYVLNDDEKLIFGVKLNHESSEYDIKKELTFANSYSDGYMLTLSAEETDIPCCKYHYDIALQTSDGKLLPVIGYSDFNVIESVVDSE